MSGKSQEQVCPHCSKSFVRIGSHKCKMAPTPTHDTNQCKAEETFDCDAQATMAAARPVMNAHFEKVSSSPADGMEQCATCKTKFKQLSKHKCKGAQSDQHTDADRTSRSEEHVVSDDTGAKEDLSHDGQSQCPSCKLYFKQLSRHKCKVVGPVNVEKACKSEGQVVRDALGAKGKVFELEQFITAADGESQCPSCKEYFKQLSRHKCKIKQPPDAEEVCKSEGEVVRDAGAKDEVLNNAADGKSQCPYCKRYFKQLSKHKCRVVQSDQHTDVEEESASQEKAPVQYKTTSKVTRRISSSDKLDEEGSINDRAVSAISSRGDAADNYNFSSLALYETVGHQPLIDTGKLDAVAVELMDSLEIDHASRPVRTGDDFFDKEVKLEQKEKQFAKSVFHPFRNKIENKLNESTCWSWHWLISGSYADGTKVTRPDEIDVMWHPDTNPKWLEPIFEGAPPGFCFVKLRKLENNDIKYRKLADLCINKGFVSSEKFRDKTHKIFEAAIEEKRKASARKDPASKEGSPSYAVELDTVPGKPPIAIDLVPCLHLEGWPYQVSPRARLPREVADFLTEQGYDIIPKACKDEKYADRKHLLWRLSFSRSEKRMTNYLDGKKIRNLQMRASADKSEVAPEQSDRSFSVPPSPSLSIDGGFESLLSRTDSCVFDADGAISAELQTNEDAERGSKGAEKKQKLPPTCRKSVLRMLKRILEIVKRFENSRSREACDSMTKLKAVVEALYKKIPDFKIEKFSTFQIRTLMWTEYYFTNPGDVLWTRENRRARLSHALTQLKKMVSGRMHVPHFFLPALDIMEDCTLKEREFLYIIFAVAEKLF